MTESVALRPVEETDRDLLFRVYAATRADEMAVVPWDERQKREFLDMQFRAQHADYSNRFPESEHSIVMAGDRDVGRIWIDRGPDEIRLLDIALLPDHRNGGIGGVLVRRLQQEAHLKGLPLRHSVDKANPDVFRLYERLGFVVIEDWGLYDLMEWQPPGSS